MRAAAPASCEPTRCAATRARAMLGEARRRGRGRVGRLAQDRRRRRVRQRCTPYPRRCRALRRPGRRRRARVLRSRRTRTTARSRSARGAARVPIGVVPDDRRCSAAWASCRGRRARRRGIHRTDRRGGARDRASHRASAQGACRSSRACSRSHDGACVITAPADEYFGQTKLSPLGVHNEIVRIGRYLDAGWGDTDDEGQRSGSSTRSTTGSTSIRATTSFPRLLLQSVSMHRWADTRTAIRPTAKLSSAKRDRGRTLHRRAYSGDLRRPKLAIRADGADDWYVELRRIAKRALARSYDLEQADPVVGRQPFGARGRRAARAAARSAQLDRHRARPRAHLHRALPPPRPIPPAAASTRRSCSTHFSRHPATPRVQAQSARRTT